MLRSALRKRLMTRLYKCVGALSAFSMLPTHRFLQFRACILCPATVKKQLFPSLSSLAFQILCPKIPIINNKPCQYSRPFSFFKVEYHLITISAYESYIPLLPFFNCESFHNKPRIIIQWVYINNLSLIQFYVPSTMILNR